MMSRQPLVHSTQIRKAPFCVLAAVCCVLEST